LGEAYGEEEKNKKGEVSLNACVDARQAASAAIERRIIAGCSCVCVEQISDAFDDRLESS